MGVATTASNNAKVPGTPKPKPGPRPDAPIQMGPAELDAIHRKVIQSIDAAGKAMSATRANVETAKSSKDDRNKVVAKASEDVGPLLAPSRHVVNLLGGLGALFPPCKQVSSTLAVLIKHEVSRQEKDVRVAIVHFDLARALVHIGSLNRKSRPGKSIGDPLSELLKNFKGMIQEFSQFCEAYYETRAPGSALKHLRHWKCNKDRLNSFADQIAQLKESLTSLLSQQAVQHPGKHTDVLAQIESRLAENRAFYATIEDANEEIAEAFLSKQLKQGGKASVRLVQDSRLLKQFVGMVGEGVSNSISSAIKKPSASPSKQVQEQVTKTVPDTKTTRRGVGAAFSSKFQGTLGKLVSGKQQKDRVDTKSGPPPLPERDQELYYLQEDEEIAYGLEVYGEDEDEDEYPYPPEDGSEEGGVDYGDPEQEDEYACGEPGVDDEGDQEACYPPEDGSGYGGADYEDPEQEDEYADREPGDDEGDQDAYYYGDDGGEVDFDDVDTDADAGGGNWILDLF